MMTGNTRTTLLLLLLGVAIGAILLRVMNPPTTQRQQVIGQQGIVRLKAPPATVPGASLVPAFPAATQESESAMPQAPSAAAVPPQQPTEPPPPPPAEPLYGAQGTVLSIDLDKKEILIELTGSTSGSPPEATGQISGEGPRQKTIQFTDTTRLEKMIVGKNPETGAEKTARHEVQLADLRPGDVVRCAYRTETPEALQGVETVSVIVEMDLNAYVKSAEFQAWLATQPAYVKGRIVSLDRANRAIVYQGYAFDQIPKNAPQQTVLLSQAARVYQAKDASELELARQPFRFEQIRVGQTIMFPVQRDAVQANTKQYQTDRVIVLERPGAK
ncbi:MAG: hypothetical protein HYY59_04165 [Candidatus Omnitrophica bacterium]|nr:hypothetical protein [Candidatus Omnitrophota bacterium]